MRSDVSRYDGLGMFEDSHGNVFGRRCVDIRLSRRDGNDRITACDPNLLPNGDFIDVTGTPFDFRTPKTIGRDIDADNEFIRYAHGYDFNYCLNGSGFRAYTVTLNVEPENATTKQWERVADEENVPEALYQDFGIQRNIFDGDEGDTFRLSKDGFNTWTVELLGQGEDASLLPTDGIAWVSFPYSASINTDYELLVGSCENDEKACTVWRKIVEKDIPETAPRWVNIPMTFSQDYYLPKMGTLSLVYYNSNVYAIGDDGNIYKSRDGGLTWKITTDFTLPEELGSYHIKAATDEKGELYLRDLDNGQLWHLINLSEAQ